MRTPLIIFCLGLQACGVATDEQPQGEAASELTVPAAPPCSAAVVKLALAQATSATAQVTLTCSLTLPAGSTMTKGIVIQGAEGSGVTVDCQGSTIHSLVHSPTKPSIAIRSIQRADGTWARPESVTVKNCTVLGNIRTAGLGINGQAPAERASSLTPGHTARAQAAAPRLITLDHLSLVGDGFIPLYVGPGTTGLTLVDSEISGTGDLAIYLDAESGGNTLRNNSIHITTDSREQVAIDGSANNVIESNRFAGLNNGGIYLYRNCGEGGTIRHQPPRHNLFINNFFLYKNYTGDNPAIWVGARNGHSMASEFLSWFNNYCPDDDGYGFGSSKSNLDHADENIIAQNQIAARAPADVIKIKGGEHNAALNRVFTSGPGANQQVGAYIAREPGCVVDWGNRVDLVPFGASADGQVCQGKTILTTPRALTLSRYNLPGAGHDASTLGAPAGYTLEGTLGYVASRPPATGKWARAVMCANLNDDSDRFPTLSGSCEEAGYLHSVLGFVPMTLVPPEPPTRQLRRCYLPAMTDHFLTSSANCEGAPSTENGDIFRVFTRTDFLP